MVAALAQRFVQDRLRTGAPLGGTASASDLGLALGETITEEGLGADDAFRRFAQVVAPASIGLDSSRFLAFIPAAPTPVSVLFDAVVSACSFSGESWLEAAGPVHAENEALRFLAGLLGLPPGAGGCFVSGGSAGNLSALAVARDVAGREPQGEEARTAGPVRVAVGDTAHASVENALALLGLRPVVVPTGVDGVLTGAALHAKLAELGPGAGVRAVVASAGSTNAGVIDDLAGLAEVRGPSTCSWSGSWRGSTAGASVLSYGWWRRCGEHDVQFVSVQEQFLDTTSDLADLLWAIFAYFANLEAKAIAARQRLNQDAKRREGVVHRGKYRMSGFTEDGYKIEPSEQTAARWMVYEFLDGPNFSAIARMMNAEGWTTTTGAPWTGQAVSQWLSRPRLAGVRESDGEFYPVKGERLIDDSTWCDLRVALEKAPATGAPWVLVLGTGQVPLRRHHDEQRDGQGRHAVPLPTRGAWATAGRSRSAPSRWWR
jgi:hypothetical protein